MVLLAYQCISEIKGKTFIYWQKYTEYNNYKKKKQKEEKKKKKDTSIKFNLTNSSCFGPAEVPG